MTMQHLEMLVPNLRGVHNMATKLTQLLSLSSVNVHALQSTASN